LTSPEERLNVTADLKKHLIAVAMCLGATAISLAAQTQPNSAPAATTQAQSQPRETPVAVPTYKYDVVSVKPSEPGVCWNRPQACILKETPDGFNKATDLLELIQLAYGLVSFNQISNAPSWGFSGYEVDAKMEEATADVLKKLSPDDRKLARQQMLQALLAERFKLVVHRETKELPAYLVFVGKSSTKLKQSSPDFTWQNGTRPPAGSSGFAIGREQDTYHALGIDISMDDLTRRLSNMLGQPVFDKTGLTGRYDFDVRFLAGDSQPVNALTGEPSSPSPPPNREFLPLGALQALGFRVESGKAPVEIIVIDHVERPSGN
jgi:uncharacterized protein (TIGR03435 family)